MKKYTLISLLILVSSNCLGQIDIPLSDCSDQTLLNATSGWGLFWADGIYNQNSFLSSLPNSAINYNLGSPNITSIPEGNGNRIDIVSSSTVNTDTGISVVNPRYIRIGGNLGVGKGSEEISRRFQLTPHNATLKISSIIVFTTGNASVQSNGNEQYFKYKIDIKYDDGTTAVIPLLLSDIITPSNHTTSTIFQDRRIYELNLNFDFSPYLNFCKNPVATISFMVSDCNFIIPQPIGYNNTNSAYAYISASCSNSNWYPIEVAEGKLCTNTLYQLVEPNITSQVSSNIISSYWTITDPSGNTINLPNGVSVYTFPLTGNYTINYNVIMNIQCTITYSCRIVIDSNCDPTTCIDCSSFDLEIGKKYLIMGWVNVMKESGPNNYIKLSDIYNYDKALISVTFLDINGTTIGGNPLNFNTSGDIIDGWQKIYGEITIPNDIDDLRIELLNNYDGDIVAFFDDIRVHPMDGNMKSFVYDQQSQKLMAELDENNYATFYDYDKEGGLVRVKKETEKGVFTIQETRSSTIKK